EGPRSRPWEEAVPFAGLEGQNRTLVVLLLTKGDERCQVLFLNEGLHVQQVSSLPNRFRSQLIEMAAVVLLVFGKWPQLRLALLVFFALLQNAGQIADLARVTIESRQYPGVKSTQTILIAKAAEAVLNDRRMVAQVQLAQSDVLLPFRPHGGQASPAPALRLPAREVVEGLLELALIAVMAREPDECLLARVE